MVIKINILILAIISFLQNMMPQEVKFVNRVIIVMTTIGHRNSRQTVIQEALDRHRVQPPDRSGAGDGAVPDQPLADRPLPRGANFALECFFWAVPPMLWPVFIVTHPSLSQFAGAPGTRSSPRPSHLPIPSTTGKPR